MPRENPLARVERELRVAPRHRLDLVNEVDTDVLALQAELERRGYGPAEARRAAVARLVPGGRVIRQLEDRHRPPLGRRVLASGWMDRAVAVGAGAAAAFAGVVAVVATASPGGAGMTAAIRWLLVFVAALMAANLGRASARLWVQGDLRQEERQLLWARQAGLIVAAVAGGALGAAWEGYLVLGTSVGASGPAFVPQSVAWEAIGSMAGVAAVGLAVALFGLFGWLLVTPRLITDEECERRIDDFFARSRPRLTPDSPKAQSHAQ